MLFWNNKPKIYVSYDDREQIEAVSDYPFKVNGEESVNTQKSYGGIANLLGKFYQRGSIVEKRVPKPTEEMRVAVICNWHDRCGISTYSKYLVDAIRPKIKEIRIFSEEVDHPTQPDEEFVVRCWRRGQKLRSLGKAVLDWSPDFVIVQHEYGIFPNASYFMQLMQMLDRTPYVVTMHSVYEHLDKAVYSSAAKHIVVHTQEAESVLRSLGNTSDIFTIHHGCFAPTREEKLWNIMQSPYTVLQFGFGFEYKGVERALEAISILRHNDSKFENIFYLFLLSVNPHNERAHDDYYESIMARAESLGVVDNICILRKYNSEKMLKLFMRLFKLAVFPYVMVPDNTVFAASGAVRMAMSNGIPVIASDSHLFDDLDGVVPRPSSADEMAKEIDEVFSNESYRDSLKEKSEAFLLNNSWHQVSDQYLAAYSQLFV